MTFTKFVSPVREPLKYDVREFRERDVWGNYSGRNLYMFSVTDGPRDLVSRYSREAAVEAGLAYVKDKYPELWPGEPCAACEGEGCNGCL